MAAVYRTRVRAVEAADSKLQHPGAHKFRWRRNSGSGARAGPLHHEDVSACRARWRKRRRSERRKQQRQGWCGKGGDSDGGEGGDGGAKGGAQGSSGRGSDGEGGGADGDLCDSETQRVISTRSAGVLGGAGT